MDAREAYKMLTENERLKMALQKYKEQRDRWFSIASGITQDKDNKDEDEEIEKILKGEK